MVDGYCKAVTRELRRIGFRYDVNAKGAHEKWTNEAGVLLFREI